MASIHQKMKEDQKRLQEEAAREEARRTELVRTDSTRLEVVKFIPNVRHHMKELGNSLALYLEETKGLKINGAQIKLHGFDNPIARFSLWQYKVRRGWFSFNYEGEVLRVDVGWTYEYQGNLKTAALGVTRTYSGAPLNEYTLDDIPKDKGFDDWFTDILLEHSRHMPKPRG